MLLTSSDQSPASPPRETNPNPPRQRKENLKRGKPGENGTLFEGKLVGLLLR